LALRTPELRLLMVLGIKVFFVITLLETNDFEVVDALLVFVTTLCVAVKFDFDSRLPFAASGEALHSVFISFCETDCEIFCKFVLMEMLRFLNSVSRKFGILDGNGVKSDVVSCCGIRMPAST